MRRASLVILVFAACDRTGTRAPAPPAPAGATVAAAASIAAPTPVADAASFSPRGEPCGALGCTQYDSASDAFLQAIDGEALVLGVGEAHAPKGAKADSAAKRFAQELLPRLAGRASDLLVELMMPPAGCSDAAAEVREKQAPATSRQAETNQNEYVAMGDRARTLGIVPDVLRPSCADLDGVRRAGDDAITASLQLIARLSIAQGERLVDRDARSDADRGKMVVLYGGMLHNDLAPRGENARWSYAPELASHVGGRFVAVDLVVPEYIGDDDTWRAFAWWPHYDRGRLGRRTTLFHTGDRSYVLVFPETQRTE
jgi:hypothetical protein